MALMITNAIASCGAEASSPRSLTWEYSFVNANKTFRRIFTTREDIGLVERSRVARGLLGVNL